MSYIRKLAILLSCVFCFSSLGMAQKTNGAVDLKEKSFKQLLLKQQEYKEVALKIWDVAELGYQEFESSQILQSMLAENGFAIESGLAGIPTSFVASYGEGEPVMAILAEFDALPGFSQTDDPKRKFIEGKEAGHACGHHLFGVGSAAAGIEIKELIEKNQIQGTIKIIGTPAEEGGAGKAYMVREGVFDGVDIVLHWHPGSVNGVMTASTLANVSAKFRFHGISSHAAGAPEKGRSALDGVESMNFMINMMREHIPSTNRIHYVITHGGLAPNVVPDFAEVYYYARSPDKSDVMPLLERMIAAGKGAAMGTGTQMEYEIIHGAYNLLINDELANAMQENLELAGGVHYTEEEKQFARSLQETFEFEPPPIESVSEVLPMDKKIGIGGSTDVGDVSWYVPTVGLMAATWVAGTPGHSWQAVACGGTDIGIKGMYVASQTMIGTVIDLMSNPKLVQSVKEEHQKNIGDRFIYEPFIGDRKPPLDYRE